MCVDLGKGTLAMMQTKKIEFFMLIKSYNLSQLSAKILCRTPTRLEQELLQPTLN